MYAEEDLLPLSGLQHLVFCERRAALVFLEGQWADNARTVQGSRFHAGADRERRRTEVRGNLRIARGLAIHSFSLGLSGKTDVVEFRRMFGSPGDPSKEDARGVALEGADGSWLPYVVEYKRGRLRREPGYLVQLCAQAICLEEMLGGKITQSALFFGEDRRRLEVKLDSALRDETEAAARRFHELVAAARTPPAVFDRRCRKCSLFRLCLPCAMGRATGAAEYLHAETERSP